MNHCPIQLIKRLSETYSSKIRMPFHIYLPQEPHPPEIKYCIGAAPIGAEKSFVGIAVEAGDDQKDIEQLFSEVCSFIETNNLL